MARYRTRQALFAVSRGYTLNERLAENRSELVVFMFRRQIDPVFSTHSPPIAPWRRHLPKMLLTRYCRQKPT